MSLGINLDGSLSKPFREYLYALAEIKFPATINTRRYMVRRSLDITRWIRQLQAAFLRAVSPNTAQCAADRASLSRDVVDATVRNMTLSQASAEFTLTCDPFQAS